MRFLLTMLAAAPALFASGPVLYTCGVNTANYWVGAKLPPSGLFRRAAPANWEQLGFNHPGPVRVLPPRRPIPRPSTWPRATA